MSIQNGNLVFPVVGAKYTGNMEWSKGIQLASVLELIPEPDNVFDSNAIKVISAGRHIGYVPSKGKTCTTCWNTVPSGKWKCPNCGATSQEIEEGGLAFRIMKNNVLNRKYACMVTEVDPYGKAFIIMAKLFWI